MKILFFFVILTTHTVCPAQGQSFVKIEFQSLSRGYFEKAVFTSDSLVTRLSKNRGSEETVTKKSLPKKQWKLLVGELKSVDPTKLPTLKSPTMKRAYDGARHSRIVLHTADNSYEHVFDDENPHELLSDLMECIIKLKKQEL